MGYKIAILDPSKEACARHFADTFIHADFDNRKGLERLCQISDVVTFEFENIDSDLLAELEKDYHIVQSASLLKTAQHRLLEKEFARSLGIETGDYQYVDQDTTGVQVDGTYLMKTVRFGYFSQEGLKFRDDQKVIDIITDIADYIDLGGGKHMTASQFLNYFLFSPEQQHNYVYKLSGGEKRKLYLCTVLMKNPNFLVLDEPTNDLDIQTLQILEDREKVVIEAYFGINQREMTLEEIGSKYNLTRERVRQIKEKAIKRLKHNSRSKILKSYLGK